MSSICSLICVVCVFSSTMLIKKKKKKMHELLRNSTKQSNLDHLHHNQRSDLDPLKTHTSLGQHTNTKNADLDPLKNTQHFSANTQRFLSTDTRITLVTEENLKSIQEKILAHTLWSISISKQSQLFKNSKFVFL